MMKSRSRSSRWVVAGVVALWAATPRAQTPAQSSPVFRTETELVLVNVVVRDKNGAVVRGLTRDDFMVTEDDKPQTITSFDFEELDRSDTTPPADTTPQQIVLPRRPVPQKQAPAAAVVQPKADMHGRRLIVPYGMSDYGATFATVAVDEVLAAME